jgi:hypothetical protein
VFPLHVPLGRFRARRELMLVATAWLDASGFIPLADRPAIGFSLSHGDDTNQRPDDEPGSPDMRRACARL